jgi:dTDP-4-amino-4,6-dideoxygalactose transaminase
MMTVSLFDTADLVAELRPQLDRRLLKVVESARFILGPEVDAFESEFADYLGVEHVVGVANGTDALVIALRALGVERGDDVVVPSFTFYATAEAVAAIGARPVFCDIDPDTFCVSAETVERALTPDTRAVVPVDLFGTPAPMVELRTLADERGLLLLEDAAQAAGARLDGRPVGVLGDAATFSFFPSKNLFCLGDGGAIATADPGVAERARLLRLHGSRDKTSYELVGYNSRLDALQAAALRVGLSRLEGWTAGRRALWEAYLERGLGEVVTLPSAPSGAEPAPHMNVVRSERRDELMAGLTAAGVESRVLYAEPVHRQPAMRGYAEGAHLPGTDLAAATNFALPSGPTRSAQTARKVIDALHQALNSP